MGAVDDDGQAVEAAGACLADVAQVAVGRVLRVDDPADPRADRAQARPARDQVLDLVLGIVVEFVAAGAEDLDAVVGHRVVRGGDHHTEIGIICAGQVGDRGRREHTDPQRVDALAGQPGDDRGFQHFAAGPRIAPDHGHAAAGSGGTRQVPGRRGAQSERQFGGQLAIGDATDAVGAE